MGRDYRSSATAIVAYAVASPVNGCAPPCDRGAQPPCTPAFDVADWCGLARCSRVTPPRFGTPGSTVASSCGGDCTLLNGTSFTAPIADFAAQLQGMPLAAEERHHPSSLPSMACQGLPQLWTDGTSSVGIRSQQILKHSLSRTATPPRVRASVWIFNLKMRHACRLIRRPCAPCNGPRRNAVKIAGCTPRVTARGLTGSFWALSLSSPHRAHSCRADSTTRRARTDAGRASPPQRFASCPRKGAIARLSPDR